MSMPTKHDVRLAMKGGAHDFHEFARETSPPYLDDARAKARLPESQHGLANRIAGTAR